MTVLIVFFRLVRIIFANNVGLFNVLNFNLTLSSPVTPNGYTSKRSGHNPPFLLFWHSGKLTFRMSKN